MKNYSFIDHTADVAISVTSDDIRSLFIDSGYALIDILFKHDTIKEKEDYAIEAEGSSKEELLINFLRELFFLFAVDKVVFKNIELKELTEDKVSAVIGGEDYDETRHKLNIDIKAVTYHDVKIVQKDKRLNVSIVFDS